MKTNRIWSAALGDLQLQMTQATFDTWLRDSKLVKHEDGLFVVGVRNGYAKDWLEHRLQPVIKRTLSRISGKPAEVKFIVYNKQEQKEEAQPTLLKQATTSNELTHTHIERANLNPRYTFDSFVVGPGNRLAHAASMAVSESPADAYNPLFLYGGVGLGKTHLLHAIGQTCQGIGLRVLYVSSEEFTNDLIDAIRAHTTDEFREKYRTADVLLVDDIQFIAGKESTQEEFFHTFNSLHSSGKQIIVSSDRAPKAMSTLEERLCSRFEWGLIADIQPPDLETRIAILQNKAEDKNIMLPDDVLQAIASQIQSNIRELEGALNRVVALAKLTHQPITKDVAESAISTLLPQHGTLDANQILKAVAEHFGLDINALRGRSRSRSVARPRQIAMYLLREETDASLPQIGDILGGRDHTTVLYGCDRISDLIEEDVNLRREFNTLKQNLYNNTK